MSNKNSDGNIHNRFHRGRYDGANSQDDLKENHPSF
jgi:hypothetical protein